MKKDWIPEHAAFIDELEKEGYKLRYSGCMTADAHHVLFKRGGIFIYPALKEKPNGKLRMLFEVQPFTFIIKNAGGMGSDGKRDIMSIPIDSLDQRSPIYLGSKYEVEKAEKFLGGRQ